VDGQDTEPAGDVIGKFRWTCKPDDCNVHTSTDRVRSWRHPQVCHLCMLSEDDVLGCVYYESRKREWKRRLINEGRCDERLKEGRERQVCIHKEYVWDV
jgi:hypothetical protein